MSNLTLNPDFETVLAPFGGDAENFFLAAGLYHAKKISIAAAAALAGLGLDQFHYRYRIKEHFGHGLTIEDETAREDLARRRSPGRDRAPAAQRNQRPPPVRRHRRGGTG